MPTSSSGGSGIRSRLPRKMASNTPGAILQPHPPPCDKLVKRGSAAAGAGEERVVMAAIVGDGSGRIVRRDRLVLKQELAAPAGSRFQNVLFLKSAARKRRQLLFCIRKPCRARPRCLLATLAGYVRLKPKPHD
jgi:hypothetical protein